MSNKADTWVFVESPNDNVLSSVGAWVEDTKLPDLNALPSVDKTLALTRAGRAGSDSKPDRHGSVIPHKDGGVQLEQLSSKHDSSMKTYLANRSDQEPVIGLWIATLPLRHDPRTENAVEHH